jgi:ankyrin repeat protein
MRFIVSMALGCLLLAGAPARAQQKEDPDGFDEAAIRETAELYKDRRTIAQIRQDNALILAAGYGDVNAVRKALKAGARINSYYIDGHIAFGSDGSGYTALMDAGSEGHVEVVKLLIEEKADLNLECRNPRYEGETALYRAVVRDRDAVVDLLVKAGAKGSPKQIRLGIDMRRAACRGFKIRDGEGYPNYPGGAGGDEALEIAEALKRGADINAADPRGYTPLMYAANLGLVENVKALLAHGADATLKTRHGSSALSLAQGDSSCARAGRREVVALLKAHLETKERGVRAPGGTRPEDEKLIAAVKGAAEKAIAADKVEAAVGSKATLNTFRAGDRDTFSIADIAVDPDRKPAMPDRDSLRWVAYWVRPVDSHNPKIVGVCWPKDGKPKVFFGEVLPPR